MKKCQRCKKRNAKYIMTFRKSLNWYFNEYSDIKKQYICSKCFIDNLHYIENLEELK